jgi:hypothetical protein
LKHKDIRRDEMRNLDINDSIGKYLKHGSYHIAMLDSYGEFANQIEEFKVPHDKLRELAVELETKQENIQIKMAKRNFADSKLDDEINSFHLHLLDHVKKNRKKPEYIQYFPKGLKAVTRISIKREIEKVKFLINTLVESSLPEKLKVFAEKIKPLNENLKSSVVDYESELFAEMRTRLNIKITKEDWLRVYNGNYGYIMSQYPRKKDMVETFFKKDNKDHKKQEDTLGDE